MTDEMLNRRRAGALIGGAVGLAFLSTCSNRAPWHAIDVSGSSSPLDFRMMRASDGKVVTSNDYLGRVVMLYFGYTFCPDACPTTLANIAQALSRLGPEAPKVQVLFVTVDPERDTLPVLARYVKQFGKQIDGLRGTPDQLTSLARRYRLAYSVASATKDHAYEVTHSSAVYVFDDSGTARLLITTLSSGTPDIAGTAADLKRLLGDAPAQKVQRRA